MRTVNLDCNNPAQQYTYAPIYYACFGPKRLPSSFKAVVGPTTSIDPLTFDCVANGWPSVATEVTLGRVDPCTFSWAWSNGNAYLNLNNGTIQPLMASDPNMPDLTQPTTSGTYWYVLDGQNLSGSCSYNPENNETTFTLSGQVVNSAGCIMPFTITYSGV